MFIVYYYRYKQAPVEIFFDYNADVKELLSSGYKLSLDAAAVQDELTLLVMFKWEWNRREERFVVINSQRKTVLGTFGHLTNEMSLSQCEFSPDKSAVAMLINKSDHSSYSETVLQVYSMDTLQLCHTFPCRNDDIRCNSRQNLPQPQFCFDPRYNYSRMAIMHFKPQPHGSSDNLVTMCIRKRKVIMRTSANKLNRRKGVQLMAYSKDGFYLVLHLVESGKFTLATTVILDGDSLQILRCLNNRRLTVGAHCSVNFTPKFSADSSLMSSLSVRTHGNKRALYVNSYFLPSPLNLQARCRRVVLRHVQEQKLDHLPLPQRIIDFLKFKPSEYHAQ